MEGGAVVSLGQVSTFLDNCGYVEEGCKKYTFDLTFGPAGTGAYFDAVAELAKDSDKPNGATRFDIPFDAKEKKYKSPEALETLLVM